MAMSITSSRTLNRCVHLWSCAVDLCRWPSRRCVDELLVVYGELMWRWPPCCLRWVVMWMVPASGVDDSVSRAMAHLVEAYISTLTGLWALSLESLAVHPLTSRARTNTNRATAVGVSMNFCVVQEHSN